MRQTALFLLLAAAVAAAGAQSKPATQTGRSAAPTHSSTAGKLAPGIPVVHGFVRTAFSLKYQDYKVGTGPLAEPLKMYHVLYTLYLASTGQVFDSSNDHRAPLIKDGKPVMGADGKPELGPPQPFEFPQGYGHLIPGFDQGVVGMHVGGKRRIFVPWQLGYGAHEIPARGGHAGMPAKSDLIFDVELVDVTDMPAPPQRPMGMAPHPGAPQMPAHPAAPAAPAQPATPPSATTPPQPK
jgi:peptidylprolyl isomerase